MCGRKKDEGKGSLGLHITDKPSDQWTASACMWWVLLSSSEITDDNTAFKLLLHWVKWLVVGLVSSWGEKLMASNYRKLSFCYSVL